MQTAFFSDSTRIITTCNDGNARVFDTDTGALHHTFTEHNKSRLRSLVVLGADIFATGDDSGVLCVFRARAKRCTYRGKHAWSVSSLAVLSSTRFVAGLFDGTLLFLHHSDGEDVAVLHSVPKAHSACLRCIDARGHRMVTGSFDKSAKVWDVDTREVIATLHPTDATGTRRALASVSISSRHIVCSAGSLVFVWDADTFALLHAFDESHHKNHVFSVLILGDRHLLTVSADQSILVTDLVTGTPVHRLVLDYMVVHGTVTSDGRIAVCRLGASPILFPAAEEVARIIRTPAANKALRILGFQGGRRANKGYHANSLEVRRWQAVADLPSKFDV